MLPYKPQLKEKARKLRKSMTDVEIRLWRNIKGKQIANSQFYRQKPIEHYIADFYCPAKKLVIEVDGGQHYEKLGIKRDKQRDKVFNQLGLRVLRFTNLDILQNLEGVMERITREAVKSPSIPLFQRGRRSKSPLVPLFQRGRKRGI